MPADRGGPVAAGPPIRPRAPAPAPPRVVANPDNQVQTPRPQGAPPSHTDITSSGPGYGSARANAYKATPAYHQAVAHVFSIQPPAQKAAILAGIARTPSIWNTPESKSVLGVWGQMDRMAKMPVALVLSKMGVRSLPGFGAQPIGKPPSGPFDFGALIGDVGKVLDFHPGGSLGPGNALTFGTSSNAQRSQLIQQGTAKIGEGLTQALSSARSSTTLPGSGTSNIAAIEGGPRGQQFAKGLASDAANLLGSPITTAAMVAGDATHPGKLLNDFTAFPKQILADPGKTFIEHPLLTGLTALGALHGASRVAAAPVRAFASPDSAAGQFVSTKREGAWLTGNLTHEQPAFSKSPTVKYMYQKPHEEAHFERRGGVLVPRTTHLKNKLLSRAIGGIVGMRERVRQVGQQMLKAEHAKSVRPSAAKVVGHAVKNTLAYGPEHATVPGGHVMSLISDTTVRRPETYTADLAKYRDLISKNRPNLLNEPEALKVHDANIKLLNHEIDAGRTPKQLAPLFKAVEKDAARFVPLEAQGHELRQFGAEMTQHGLERRTLEHYATLHMGAKMDAERGLLDAHGQPLSNRAIIEHIKGPHGTGGRMPVYTADYSHPDLRGNPNKAFYVPGERRPTPNTARNTLYNYTHGLINPSHTALLERKLELQGKIDAHHTQNTLINELVNQLPGGGYAKTYGEAQQAAPKGMRPINIAEMFHPQAALDKAIEGTDPAEVEHEAALRGISLKDRTAVPTGDGKGRWGLVDEHATKALGDLEKHISPSPVLRSIKALNNQFRTVVLSTSAKHVPGVMFENLIRDIGYGVGVRSWVTGRGMLKSLKQNATPDEARLAKVQQTGGQLAGMVESQRVYRVSDHWAGTSAYRPLRAMEASFKTPGIRQARTAWRAWTTLAIKGTKKVLEEQHQTAGIGKGALMEHGYAEAYKLQGFVGMFHRVLGLQGQMLDDAAKGLLDPKKARQARELTNRMYGRWTDLSPSAQTGLMFSPFGLWWVNSARFLARLPVDQPVKTALLASATAATQQRRQGIGMDILGPNALPGYLQGGIPAGNKDIAMNYYSPAGTVNDPLSTGVSLAEPWWLPVAGALLPHGVDYLGKPLSSPGNPRGNKAASGAQKVQYVLNSVLSSLVPMYSAAERVAAGGASTYDTSNKGIVPNPLNPPTKTRGKGLGPGLATTFRPWRQYNRPAPGGSSGGGSGIFGGSSGSSGGSSGAGMFGSGSSGGSGGGSGMFK